MTSSSTDAKHKPFLDETGFEQLLAAAYVLQQHNDSLRAKDPRLDPAAVLSEIAKANLSDCEEGTASVGEIESVQGVNSPPIPETLAQNCRVCGRPFGEDEAFCGNCSMPRVAETPSEDLQSKWASLWYMQQAQDTLPTGDDSSPSFTRSGAEEIPARLNSFQYPAQGDGDIERPVLDRDEAGEVAAHRTWPLDSPSKSENARVASSKVANAAGEPASTSAIRAGDSAFLRNLRDAFQTFQVRIRTGRRDATWVIASLAVVLIVAMWGLWPAHSSSQPQLSLFDSLLVELGLAEVPARTPVYGGNPDARVWVDVHTALYYCQGSDLYGKTPGGRFRSQRGAQEDQFEPASRVACE